VAGYRSGLAFWIGGAASPPIAYGVRGMLAFWAGGACAGVAPAPGPEPAVEPATLIAGQSAKARERLQREQEERAALSRQIVITSIGQIIASGALDA